jgi:glycogen debranching enzyme
MIQFNKETCGNLRRRSPSGVVVNQRARRLCLVINYRTEHPALSRTAGGRYEAAVGRIVMLSKLEETLFIDGQPFDLSANCYPGAVHPQGFRYLRQFRLDPFPVFTYEVEGIAPTSAWE